MAHATLILSRHGESQAKVAAPAGGAGNNTIRAVKAREIFDSRGNSTVEVDLCTETALFRAAVPSGALDGDKNRLLGKGVLQVVSNVNDILAPNLVGLDVTDQAKIDKLMVEEIDGSKNEWGWSKSKVGANAILAVSMAVCRAGAAANGMPLYQYIAKIAGKPTDEFVMPVPSFNVINGGSHAENRLACQEFMILPVGASTFKEAMIIGAEVYHNLKSVIKKKYGQDACNVGDEGGFAPNVQDNNEALDVLMEAIAESGHSEKVKIGTDVAASEFYTAEKQHYDLDFKNQSRRAEMKKTATQLADYYKSWLDKYPFVSIEDPFDKDDWDAYKHFMTEVGQKVQIVGDDLLVTNPTRVKKALEVGACNALLLKVNQIGSITDAIEAATMSQNAGWGVMVSHGSGETEDSFIPDLVVGLRTGQIKTGAPCRERLAKYNQLLRIEEELGPLASFAGTSFRNTSPLPPASSGPQLNEKGQSTSPSIPAPSASHASQSAAVAAPEWEGQCTEEERRLLQSMGFDPDGHDIEEGGLEESEINAAREHLTGQLQADPRRRWQGQQTTREQLDVLEDTPRASSGLQVNEAFPVGSELVVLEAALMRESQELSSAALAQLEKDRRLLVLGYGQGIRSRRLYVHDPTSRRDGWISATSLNGKQLVAPTASFSEVSTFGKKSNDDQEHRKRCKKSRNSRKSTCG